MGPSVLFGKNRGDGIGYVFVDPASDELGPESQLSFSTANEGPGPAESIAFSNFRNSMAFWEINNEDLTLSNLPYEEIQSFPASNGGFPPESFLTWTPDDLHLIISQYGETPTRWILDVKTGTVENWNYLCNQVVVSPKSGRLALGCVTPEHPDELVLMEWGGEIWVPDQPPGNVLTKWENENYPWLDIYSVLGWSSNGNSVAYFDQMDPEGHLYIAGAEGVLHKILPGGAYWLSPYYNVISPLTSKPIQWAHNGSRLLALARGTKDKPCPKSTIASGPNQGIYENDACWQVIDVESGEVIWRLTDAIEDLAQIASVDFLESRSFITASISPDGNLLALTSIVGGFRNLFIIEIDSNEVIRQYPIFFQYLRWGESPSS